MNATAVWWRFPLSKDPPIDLLLARILIKNRMIQVRSLKQTDPDRLCAFSWRASGLGFVLFWSFESLPQCLRIRRVGLSLNCWECWVVRGQLTQKYCQNVSETEWLFRACDAQSFPWLAYWMSFQDIHQIEELVIHPHVNLRLAKKSDSALLWETAVCFLHIHEIGTNVCGPNTHSKPPDVDFYNLASHLQMKHPGINQVCNLQSDSPHDRIVWSSLFD